MTLADPGTTPEGSSGPRVKAWLAAAWRLGRPWAGRIVGAALVVAATVAVIRPWAPLPPDPTAEDVAAQWNQSVGRLGIEPVFPPEEDIYVGDIYAIVTGVGAGVTDAPGGGTAGPQGAGRRKPDAAGDARTFIGSSVKLDHVNVRWAFDTRGSGLPIFAETVKTGDDKVRFQPATEADPRPEDADTPIRLSIAAFPGVTITHATTSSAALGFQLAGSTAQREGLQVEEIHIPVAETYGITAPDGVAALDQWCSAPKTAPMCTRAFALRMLSFVLGSDVLERHAGPDGAAPTIGLLLVGRVFAARELDTRRVTSTTLGGALHMAPVPAVAGAGAADGAGAEAATLSRSAGSSEVLKQVFQRPVVFGIRSIKRDLD